MKEGPWGGGNQFLKALKLQLEKMGIYEENPKKSDAIIFNSFENSQEVLGLKRDIPKIPFIHRVDGPISLVRGQDKILDRLIFSINHSIADGTIFQSKWCKDQSFLLGMKKNKFETIIYNAPDESIFNEIGKSEFNPTKKIKLISVSWSNNWNKGFNFYQFLDKNLDWNRYEMTFIGRSPLKFDNIKMLGILNSRDIAKQLKQSDIFITASKDEPCSNALIEALSCGLPSLALSSGGSPELIEMGGELFLKEEEMIDKLDILVKNYSKYKNNLPKFSIEQATQKYLNFIQLIKEGLSDGSYSVKRVGLNGFIRSKFIFVLWFIKRILNKLF